METFKPTLYISIFLLMIFTNGCGNNDSLKDTISSEITLSQYDKDALLFMFKEEKLARDTYVFLDSVWAINPFSNIKNSEQTHMNAVENLLMQNQIEYHILRKGKFENQELQSLYNQFKVNGVLSMANAFKIGATIEDLDIIDLQNNIDNTTNQSIISVFESLQCGSKNHLKSFVSALENINETYTPQFLSNEQYKIIIESSSEQCNKN